MSVKFKESTQWYKIFHVRNDHRNDCLLWKRDQKYRLILTYMNDSIGIISCEKLCLELPSEAPSFPLWKEVFRTTAVTFYEIEQPLNPQPWDAICAPAPSYLWLVKCLILRVRYFKCIFLKCLLLYRLCKFFSRIPETWSNQSPIVSRW